VDQSTDEQLVEEYLAGDEGALRTLIGRYVGAVYRFVYRYVGEAGNAQDITQDVFVNAWRHLKRFDRKKKFKTWLFAIAKHASLNWLKKKKPLLFSEFSAEGGSASGGENRRSENVLAETLADPAPLPEELFARNDLVLQLSLALQKLHPAQRAVLLMHYQDQLTFQEIGELLGEPLHTVKSRHRRGLLALRKLLLS
jgi:RNA polymerase sigma-70 factor (ECF subfamily)